MYGIRPAIALTLFFVVLTGLAFPVIVWALGTLAFPSQAHGSLIRDARGTIIGSALIGQNFTKPEYFHPRPSAAGTGYDAMNSGGTNLGPTSDKLIYGAKDDPNTTNVDETYLGFEKLAKMYRAENGLPDDALVPADAVTRSGSGLDPHISPANARIQASRVAKARRVALGRIEKLIDALTEGRMLLVLGEPRVNVLKLNLAVDALK